MDQALSNEAHLHRKSYCHFTHNDQFKYIQISVLQPCRYLRLATFSAACHLYVWSVEWIHCFWRDFHRFSGAKAKQSLCGCGHYSAVKYHHCLWKLTGKVMAHNLFKKEQTINLQLNLLIFTFITLLNDLLTDVLVHLHQHQNVMFRLFWSFFSFKATISCKCT